LTCRPRRLPKWGWGFHGLLRQRSEELTYDSLGIKWQRQQRRLSKDYERKRPNFGPTKFSYDAERDVSVCPLGRPLRRYHVEYTQQSGASTGVIPLSAMPDPSAMKRLQLAEK
jgi:hypothetical protein